MKLFKQIFKSKTIDLNAAYALGIAALQASGYNVDPELVAYGATGMNIILRFITKEAITDK